MDLRQKTAALALRIAIENHADGGQILCNVQELVTSLGGVRTVYDMQPQAATLYVISLLLSQPDQS